MNNNYVKIVETGPRDGLQSEKCPISTEAKIKLVNRLSACGFQHIETGSFVSPKWVPQMADSAAVFEGIERFEGVVYSALASNMIGWENARKAEVDEIAIFASASESFSLRNLNCDIKTSLARFQPVVDAAAEAGVAVRGYVSCILGCPYEGEISPSNVVALSERLMEMGCYEISLGDTIGTGTAGRTRRLLKEVTASIPVKKIAMHMHDTYGQAVANVYASLEEGVRTFDSSVGGIGGCPYARGATGNVASEDVAYLLEREGFNHGIDLERLSQTGLWINQLLGKAAISRAGLATLNKKAQA